MSASDMASKLSGMSFAFGLRTQFAELVKRTKDQMDESEESDQPPSEEKSESAPTEEKEAPTATPVSPDQQAAEKATKISKKAEAPADKISQHQSPEEKPRSVRDMIARFQGGDSSGGSPRKSRPKEPSKPSPEPPGKDKQRVVAKKEEEKPKEEKIATKAAATTVASKPATEQTSTVSSKPTEHIEEATEKTAMNLVTRAIRGIEQKAETVLNKQKDTPVVVPVTKEEEKEVAPVVTESKPREAPSVEPSSSKTEKPAAPMKETSTVEVRAKEPDIVQPVQKMPEHKKQPSIEKQTLQERKQEVKKETPEALVSQESPPVHQVQPDQPPPTEDQGKGAVPQKAPPETDQDGKADLSHLAVRKAKKVISRDRSSSYDPESDHSGDETSSGEGPASRAGSVIMSSPEPSPDEEEMGCKTFMEMFVSNVFNGSPVGPDEQSHFGEMCRKPAGRKWFARQVNSERCNTKCVSETTFYRLVQCFAIALFECGEADDFIPAKILMNMCFTFYYEDQPEPGKEQKVFLYMYLKDQPVW
ncbi:KIAA0513 [Branchiostoma lanceolatum]|uniref:KIAA0513 protein n=2 Tax=Branchiostoma lanceolatum TaxID=7740 RepID=A0A8K0F093_BRALA|nr:KIAA0513 [Branchiostoma lanceolatum]